MLILRGKRETTRLVPTSKDLLSVLFHQQLLLNVAVFPLLVAHSLVNI